MKVAQLIEMREDFTTINPTASETYAAADIDILLGEYFAAHKIYLDNSPYGRAKVISYIFELGKRQGIRQERARRARRERNASI